MTVILVAPKKKEKRRGNIRLPHAYHTCVLWFHARALFAAVRLRFMPVPTFPPLPTTSHHHHHHRASTHATYARGLTVFLEQVDGLLLRESLRFGSAMLW